MSNWDDSSDTGEYSVDDDNQLQPEDTLVDRGVDDILDEGISPPERPYGRTALDHPGPETLDELLAEEEPDPAARLNNVLDELNGDNSERDSEFPEDDEVGRAARAGWWRPMQATARTTTPSSTPPTSASTVARHRPRRPRCTSSTTKRISAPRLPPQAARHWS